MKLTLSRIITASYGDELKPKPNIPNGEDQGVGLIAGAHDCHLLHVPPVHFEVLRWWQSLTLSLNSGKDYTH